MYIMKAKCNVYSIDNSFVNATKLIQSIFSEMDITNIIN